MTIYDSDKPPSDINEAEDRIREAIIWEFLDEDCGLFMESPNSTYNNWNEAAQKRYRKAAKKIKAKLMFKKPADNNYTLKPKVKQISKSVNRKPTLRDYMREYVGN
jgi:hypothetical protein